MHTYLTPTSEHFAARESTVVAVVKGDHSEYSFTVSERPALECRDELKTELKAVAERRPLLPLVEQQEARRVLGNHACEATIPQWKMLLANFPLTGLRLVEAVEQSKQSSELSADLQA